MLITVPGASNIPVTVSTSTGDAKDYALQIGNLLATIQGNGGLDVTTYTGSGSIPAASAVDPTLSELVLSVSGGYSGSIPGGYNYIVEPLGYGPDTITATNAFVIGSTDGFANLALIGNSTLAAPGGDSQVQAIGTYDLSFGPGNNGIYVVGSGTVSDGSGQSTIVASSGNNLVQSNGTGDLIFGLSGSLTAALSGDSDTVAPGITTASVTASGNDDLIFGGSGTLAANLAGANDTVVGGSGPSTITASGNNGDVVFGGPGAITYLGGAGTGTIVGGTTQTFNITAGSGGVLFSSGMNDTSTVTASAGDATIFGGSGSIINLMGSNQAVYLAGGGNETLNAAASSGTDLLVAGQTGGSTSLVGGSGSNTFFAGNGPDTFTGGSGSNLYAFFKAATGGAHDYISNFNAADSVYVIDYDPNGSASALDNAATVGANGVTVTLSDNTQLTFSNLTDVSQIYGKILYVPPPIA